MTRIAAEGRERAAQIAFLNDRARQAMGICCVVVAPEGFRTLPVADQSRVHELVERLDAFTPDNDPYGERDFGAIYKDCDGRWTTKRPTTPVETVFWKIDAYDHDLRFGSEDPAQIVMPGVKPVSVGERLNWQVQLPMQPRRAQKPLDIGFWDPMRDQLEMF